MARSQKIRYAVVGLGYIAQQAVLPAFAHAKSACELTALVSGDPEKLEVLGKKYGVENLYSYEQYEECLRSGKIDAVYIALPNSMHCEFTVKAAAAGIHVLCEKPMAVTEDECRKMLSACEENDVRLMIAYRLHFEEANMRAAELVASGEIGEPRVFTSVFCMQVREGDIRTQDELGGGALYDIGIYCINAARYLFRKEPKRVTAMISSPKESRFAEVDGITGALLEFDEGQMASFVASHGASDCSAFDMIGTKGQVCLSPAYDFEGELWAETNIEGKVKEKTYPARDQFAPLLVRFAECIHESCEPEPCGHEGLADIRIIEAIQRSAKEGRAVMLAPFVKESRPGMDQEMKLKSAKAPKLFHAQAPTQE